MIPEIEELKKHRFKASARTRAEIQERRAVANSYFYFGRTREAAEISLEWIGKAKKMHEASCVVDFCRHIRYYYSVINPNRAKFRKFDRWHQDYLVLQRVEQEIDSMYSRQCFHIRKPKGSGDEA